MKKPGYFTDNGHAYVVTEPYTQIPLTNVLLNDMGYLTELTQWGTGTSSVKFADRETCLITEEMGKALFLRNEQTGTVWCPGIEPMHSKVEDFRCEHGDGYSIVSSTFEGIDASVKTFIPRYQLCEVWSVELCNHRLEEVTISCVPMVRLCLTGYTSPRFCDSPFQSYITSFCEDMNALYFEGRNPNAKDKPYDVVLAASEKINYYSGCDRKTLAAPAQLSYPYILLKGGNLDSITDVGGGGLPFMAVQCVLTLKPGESRRVDFTLGVCRNKEEAREIVQIVRGQHSTEDEYKALIKELEIRRETLMIHTPDEKVNAFVNLWLKKGMEYCLIKKDATRDNLQFAFGLTMVDSEITKKTIRLAMHHQYQDGHTVRSWKPLDETYYSDGPLWLPLLTCDYVKYTGDTAFLSEKIPYFDKGEATVLEHLYAGVERLDADRGPHGLCLARWADWNDALNLVDPEAESVFVTMALAWNFKDMAELMTYLGRMAQAKVYSEKYEELRKWINETCWDTAGEYYVRGFSGGKVIGGSGSEGSIIYANAQTWAVLSGVATEKRIPKLRAAMDKYIRTDLGCLVNYPAYEQYSPELGRISYQVPGTTENGAVYCHATAFKINADIQLEDGDRAYCDLKRIMPDSEENPYENSGALPYALTSCYATNPLVWGRTGRPWLTGSQGWVVRCVVEGLLGVRKTYGGFLCRPALPTAWDKASCTIKRKGTSYHFTIRRTGASSVTIDGKLWEQGFIPFVDQDSVEIIVTV